MSNFVLAYSDLSRNANYSGGTYQSGHDTDMLKRDYISATMRTTDLTDLDLDVTLNASQDNKVVGLINHNLSATGTWRIRAYSDAARTNNLYDSGALTIGAYDSVLRYKTCLKVLDSAYTTAYWRITLSDSGNMDGYFKLGNLFIGKKFANDELLMQNMNYGLTRNVLDDNTDVFESTAGVESFNEQPIKRQFTFSMTDQNETLADDYFLMALNAGKSDRVLFELDSDNFKQGVNTMVARMNQASALESSYYTGYGMNFVVKEII